jgi:TPR repeat protein
MQALAVRSSLLRRGAMAFFCALLALAVAATATAAETADKAAKADSAQRLAMRSEALSYEHGEGVPKDPLRAARLYCQAALLGDAEAQFNLGWMYANGRGVERDDTRAAYFFGLAAKQGHAQSQKMLRFVGEPGPKLPECMLPTVLADDGRDVLVARSEAQEVVFGLVRQLAPEYGVSPRLALAVIRTESNFNSQALSNKMHRA